MLSTSFLKSKFKSWRLSILIIWLFLKSMEQENFSNLRDDNTDLQARIQIES